ncbi:MAG: hypothetical protein WC045_01880 [Patescibacteria group bacterium]
MFGSILLLIYALFLIAYVAVMGYAMYRVWLFGQYRALAGMSILVTLCFVIAMLGIIAFTLIGIGRYTWDDSAHFYIDKLIHVSDQNTQFQAKTTTPKGGVK